MKPPRQHVFVERQTYRRRRLRDAARILPVVGLLLILLPMLWAPDATGARQTGTDGIYLFLVWAGLVLAAALMAPRLEDESDPDPPEG